MSFKKSVLALAITNVILPSPSFGADITVTTLEDAISVKCTLRDALRSVNSGGFKGGCTSSGILGNNDRILFQAKEGTIQLNDVDSYGIDFTSRTLYVGKDLELNPTGSNITIQAAQGPGSPISVYGSYQQDIRVVFNNLTIKGGSAFSGGTMSVSMASLTLKDSSVNGGEAARGGGIDVRSGALTLENSTVSGNTAVLSAGGIGAEGGVIYLYRSSLSLIGSTISANSANNGGGIASRESTITMENSTVSANSALEYGGGVVAYDSTIILGNTTMSNNISEVGESGGIALALSELRMTNSIIANSSGGDCLDLFGTVIADRYNIIEDGSCATQALSGDPKLDPLRDNGGPTNTHALLASSIAINTGKNGSFCPEFDQRARIRVDGSCDIGAFELGAQVPETPQPISLAGVLLLLGD